MVEYGWKKVNEEEWKERTTNGRTVISRTDEKDGKLKEEYRKGKQNRSFVFIPDKEARMCTNQNPQTEHLALALSYTHQ